MIKCSPVQFTSNLLSIPQIFYYGNFHDIGFNFLTYEICILYWLSNLIAILPHSVDSYEVSTIIAAKILPVVKNQHLLLCTLLICNAAAMEVRIFSPLCFRKEFEHVGGDFLMEMNFLSGTAGFP